MGSGKGSKSGRGTTRHQSARGKIPLHFEGGQGRLVKRYPLLRGKGKNKSRAIKPSIISLSRLNIFSDGDVVEYATLLKKGLVEEGKDKTVKILNDGGLKKKLTVRLATSKAAKQAIEKAGGTVEVK